MKQPSKRELDKLKKEALDPTKWEKVSEFEVGKPTSIRLPPELITSLQKIADLRGDLKGFRLSFGMKDLCDPHSIGASQLYLVMLVCKFDDCSGRPIPKQGILALLLRVFSSKKARISARLKWRCFPAKRKETLVHRAIQLV